MTRGVAIRNNRCDPRRGRTPRKDRDPRRHCSWGCGCPRPDCLQCVCPRAHAQGRPATCEDARWIDGLVDRLHARGSHSKFPFVTRAIALQESAASARLARALPLPDAPHSVSRRSDMSSANPAPVNARRGDERCCRRGRNRGHVRQASPHAKTDPPIDGSRIRTAPRPHPRCRTDAHRDARARTTHPCCPPWQEGLAAISQGGGVHA